MNYEPLSAARKYNRYLVRVAKTAQRTEVIVLSGLTLSLFAIAFFGLFALKPTLITITGLWREIQEKKELDQRLKGKINDLQQAQQNYAQMSKSLYLLNEAVPSTPTISDLIYQLENAAVKSNLEFSTANFASLDFQGNQAAKPPIDSKAGPGISEVQFDLTVKGNYDDIKKFLLSLEGLRRLLIIDSFLMSQNISEEERGQNKQEIISNSLKLTLRMRAFYLLKT